MDEGQPVDLQNNFEGFQALYKNFLQIKQQINLQNFATIGAEDKYDNVSCAYEIIDHIFRQLSCIEYQAKKRTSSKRSVDFSRLIFSSKKC